MHIRIPSNYVQEVPKSLTVDVNGNRLTPEKRKALEGDFLKLVLNVSSTDGKNVAGFGLVKQTAKTGNFAEFARSSKHMHTIRAGQKMTNYDTLSSILHASNIEIHKFQTFSTTTRAKLVPKKYSVIYLASVKDYFLEIILDYTDKTFAEKIEKAILTSTFN